MAYTPVLNDILEMRVVTQDQTSIPQLGINRVYWSVSGITGLGVTQGQIAAFLDGLLSVNYLPLMPASCLYRGVSIQKVSPTPPVVAASAIAHSGTGTGAGALFPAQATILVSLQTAMAGRAFRGRIFLPFISTTYLTGTEVPAAGAIVLAANIGGVLDETQLVTVGANATTITPVIWHRKGYGYKSGPPVVPINPATIGTVTAITGSTAVAKWATIRRRGDYGRANATLPF